MLPMKRRWSLFAVSALSLGAILVASIAWALSQSGSGQADTGIRVVDPPSVFGADVPTEKSFLKAGDALAYASARAGFHVPAPTYLPPGYALVEIGISPKPPVEAPTAPLRATLKMRKGNEGFQILAVSKPFAFIGQDPSKVIASPTADSQIYKDASDYAIAYTLITPTKGAVMTVLRASSLTDDDALQILRSLPLD